MNTINIAHVSVKQSDRNFDLITLHQFLKFPLVKRHELIREHKVEFIGADGEKIKIIDGLKAITELIKTLREEGKYMQFMSA